MAKPPTYEKRPQRYMNSKRFIALLNRIDPLWKRVNNDGLQILIKEMNSNDKRKDERTKMNKEQIKQNFIEELQKDNSLFEVNYGNGEINRIKIEDAVTVTVDFEKDSDQRVFVRQIGYKSSTQLKCISEVLRCVNKLLEGLERNEDENER